jgi:hypothetical protein
MLAYLEDLCGALIAHDTDVIQRLLAHPLARSLPRQVREEAIAISRASAASLRAPIQTLRFYHQTLQLGPPGQDTQPSEPTASEPAAGDSSDPRADAHSDPHDDAHSDADPDRGPSHTQGPMQASGQGYGQTREPHGREVQRHHVTGREQIELPLESPRKAQAA